MGLLTRVPGQVPPVRPWVRLDVVKALTLFSLYYTVQRLPHCDNNELEAHTARGALQSSFWVDSIKALML